MDKQAKEFYRIIAHCYDELLGLPEPKSKKQLALIERLLTGKRVLDLGCGTGRILVPLSKKGYVMYGLDISEEMLDVAQTKLSECDIMDLRVGSATEPLPYEDDFFDGVICCHAVLQHFPPGNPRETWAKEMYRILAPNGVLIADTHALWRNIDKYEDELCKVWRTDEKTSIHIDKATGAQCRMYWWNTKELEHLLRDFSTVDFLGDYDGSRYIEGKSPRIIVVARK